LLPLEWFSLFFYTFWLYICNIGGTGGGGSMVPLIRIIDQFNNKDAIAISNATIAISGLIRYVMHFRKNHPSKKDTDGKPAGTIVDYNLTVILVPAVVVGSAIGVIVNYITPEPIQIGVSLVFLLVILSTTIPKFFLLCKTERAAMKAKAN
jgi:uncharacterized membrane protein YfcA